MAASDDDSCTKVEVSELLGLSLQAVDDLIESGALESRRAGRTFLVARADVERYRASQT